MNLIVLLSFSILGVSECTVCSGTCCGTFLCDTSCCQLNAVMYNNYELYESYNDCCTTTLLQPLPSPSPKPSTKAAPATASLSTRSPSSTSESWKAGSIAGVVIGAVCFLIVVVVIVVYCCRHHCGMLANVRRHSRTPSAVYIVQATQNTEHTTNTSRRNKRSAPQSPTYRQLSSFAVPPPFPQNAMAQHVSGIQQPSQGNQPCPQQGIVSNQPMYSQIKRTRRQVFLGSQSQIMSSPTYENETLEGNQSTKSRRKRVRHQASLVMQPSNLENPQYQQNNSQFYPQNRGYQQHGLVGSQLPFPLHKRPPQPTSFEIQKPYPQNQFSQQEDLQDQLSRPWFSQQQGNKGTKHPFLQNQVPGATLQDRQLPDFSENYSPSSRNIVIVQSNSS